MRPSSCPRFLRSAPVVSSRPDTVSSRANSGDASRTRSSRIQSSPIPSTPDPPSPSGASALACSKDDCWVIATVWAAKLIFRDDEVYARAVDAVRTTKTANPIPAIWRTALARWSRNKPSHDRFRRPITGWRSWPAAPSRWSPSEDYKIDTCNDPLPLGGFRVFGRN